MRLLCALALYAAHAQQPQNPSPMVEHTRAHPRLKEQAPPGRREKLIGYAGDSAPDHVDQLHSLPIYLKALK